MNYEENLNSFQSQLTSIAVAAMEARTEVERLKKQFAEVQQENTTLKAKFYDIEHKGVING